MINNVVGVVSPLSTFYAETGSAGVSPNAAYLLEPCSGERQSLLSKLGICIHSSLAAERRQISARGERFLRAPGLWGCAREPRQGAKENLLSPLPGLFHRRFCTRGSLRFTPGYYLSPLRGSKNLFSVGGVLHLQVERYQRGFLLFAANLDSSDRS